MDTGKKKRSPLGKLLLVLALVVAIAGGLVYTEVSGGATSHTPLAVQVPRGAGTAAVATALKKEGIINSTFVFQVYSRLNGGDGTYQFGSFMLVPHAPYAEILRVLQTPAARTDVVSITIPEGYNAYQIAQKLEAANLCTAEEFIEVLNTAEFPHPFLPVDHSGVVRVEGFLFPDTYQFETGMAPEEIATVFLNTFQKKVLTQELQSKLENSPYTLYELVTFASIIQKEAANVEEMYNVSAVFTNRMNNTAMYPRLESCTTNDYINDYVYPLYNNDPPQALLDGYDTYSRSGLPLAPIANPGMDAILAALTPNDTPYYFFVTDITYKHYYAETYAQHLKNIEEAKAVNLTYGKVGL